MEDVESLQAYLREILFLRGVERVRTDVNRVFIFLTMTDSDTLLTASFDFGSLDPAAGALPTFVVKRGCQPPATTET